MSATETVERTAERTGVRRRALRIQLGKGLIGVIAAFAILFDALGIFSILTGLFFINALAGDFESHQALSSLPQLLQADLREGATADLTDLGFGVRVLCALPTFVHLLTVLSATILVTRAIREIASGDPFTSRGIRAWAGLGVVLIVGGVLQGVLDTVAVRVLSTLARAMSFGDDAGGWPLGGDYSAVGIDFPDWPWIFLALGVVAGTIAVAFREGARLKSEADGVV
ncbi:hypothetical protein ET445_04575 [Agromyces protaetiae]|uniref:DUF2975 domain-containing protein n=1 Tax=Agromyces protaetiae TaxID=2509455 RepID=A0A4P6FCN8_9MICO|nr:hypothetical protein [Agromyces protaetiae]QAY72723.1 hypothetical protein ET445_04575 [Agromyces protaetiae]